MSNFAYKYEIKKISLTEVHLGLHFPRYITHNLAAIAGYSWLLADLAI